MLGYAEGHQMAIALDAKRPGLLYKTMGKHLSVLTSVNAFLLILWAQTLSLFEKKKKKEHTYWITGHYLAALHYQRKHAYI